MDLFISDLATRAWETPHDMASEHGPPGTGPSRGRSIQIVCIVAPIITGIFVLMRAYSRFFIVKKVFVADWISFVTLIFVICFSITLYPAPNHGMGRHIWDFNRDMSSHMYFWIMVSSAFYVLSLAGYKAALLFLYLQIFGVHKKFRYTCYAVLFYTMGYLTCNLIIEFAGCQPIQKFYEPWREGHCTNSTAQNIAFGVGHMTSDLLIAILPIPMVFKLKLRSRREKIGLAFVLGSGAIAWIVAVIRFIIAVVDLTVYDRTWIAGITFFMSVLEVNTGLICGCTPALKPLFIHVRKNSAGWSRKFSSAGGSWHWSKRRGTRDDDTAGQPELSDPFSKSEKGGFTQLKDLSNSSKSDSSREQTQTEHTEDIDNEQYDPRAKTDVEAVGRPPSTAWPLPVDSSNTAADAAGEDRHPGVKRMTSDELFHGSGIAPHELPRHS